jgi:hypothetical protein
MYLSNKRYRAFGKYLYTDGKPRYRILVVVTSGPYNFNRIQRKLTLTKSPRLVQKRNLNCRGVLIFGKSLMWWIRKRYDSVMFFDKTLIGTDIIYHECIHVAFKLRHKERNLKNLRGNEHLKWPDEDLCHEENITYPACILASHICECFTEELGIELPYENNDIELCKLRQQQRSLRILKV